MCFAFNCPAPIDRGIERTIRLRKMPGVADTCFFSYPFFFFFFIIATTGKHDSYAFWDAGIVRDRFLSTDVAQAR